MKLDLEEVCTMFSIVDNVGLNAAIPSSQFVRMEHKDGRISMTLTGTLWINTFLKTNASEAWLVYIDRKALRVFLSTATGKELDMKVKDNAVHLVAGQKLSIPSNQPVTGYENWKPTAPIQLEDWQKDLLPVFSKYCPLQAGLENTAAVAFVKGFGVVATDTMMIAGVHFPKQAQSFFLPAEAINVMNAFGVNQICIDKKGIGVVEKSPTFAASAFQPLHAELDKYPSDQTKRLMDMALKAPTMATLSIAELSETVEALTEFLDSKLLTATLTWNKGLSFSADVYGGKFERHVKAQTKSSIDSTRWSVRSLAPWIALQSKDKGVTNIEYARLKISDTINGTVLRSNNGERTAVLLFADV